MMKTPQEMVSELVSVIGQGEAVRALVIERISPFVALRLAKGRYDHKLGPLQCKAIEAALAKAKTQSA